MHKIIYSINVILISIACVSIIGANPSDVDDRQYHAIVIKEHDQVIAAATIPSNDIIAEEPAEEPAEARGRWVRALVTAYTPWDAIDSNSGYQDGYTSTMVDTTSGDADDIYGIAADPRAIPYGTRIYVPGYWESLQNNTTSIPSRTIVDDTGGNMRKNWDRGIIHIDVRYRTTSAALKWGKRWVNIFIYE